MSSSSQRAEKEQPKDFQKYIDQLLKELEKSYTAARRQSTIWFILAITFAVAGMAILIILFIALATTPVSGNATSTSPLFQQLVKDTSAVVAWMAGGVALIFIATLFYRQVRETNLQIDNYYLGRIQEAKRISQSIKFSSVIETDEKTKDQLNELIMQQFLGLLT